MLMNWNSNDTKYILKKVIVLLLSMFAIFIIGTWKANALEIKPSGAVMVLDNGGVYLANNNINNTIIMNNTKYWEIYQYNDSSRISWLDVYGGFDPTYDYQRVEFNFAMDVVTSGDINDIDVTDFRVYIPDNVYNECGITWRYNYQRLDNVTTAIYNVECAVVQPIRYIEIVFRKNTTNYQNKKFFMTDIEVLPSTEEQTKQLVDKIHDLQEIQNQWLENSYTGSADSDFNNSIFNSSLFDDNTGLQSVITLPLSMINNLTSTCQPINLPLPFVNGNFTLPCMSTIYQQHFSSLYSVIAVIVNGFFVYRILLKIYELVHDAKDPAKDKLEVVEL